MKAVAAFLLALCYLAVSDAVWTCTEAPRLSNAYQIDAGQGNVVARDSRYIPYFLMGSSWRRMSSLNFRHLTVGPAGLWGVGTNYGVYKYVAGNFLRASAFRMRQVDAGGNLQVVGASTSTYAYCLRATTALAYNGMGSVSWTSLSRRLIYYSCSPLNGCWGVDTSYRVYYTQILNSATCGTARWRLVGSQMKMIEVATDGTVVGVDRRGQVLQRVGTSRLRPYGTRWVQIPMCMAVRHVSYDLRRLWVVTTSGLVMRCTP